MLSTNRTECINDFNDSTLLSKYGNTAPAFLRYDRQSVGVVMLLLADVDMLEGVAVTTVSIG